MRRTFLSLAVGLGILAIPLSESQAQRQRGGGGGPPPRGMPPPRGGGMIPQRGGGMVPQHTGRNPQWGGRTVPSGGRPGTILPARTSRGNLPPAFQPKHLPGSMNKGSAVPLSGRGRGGRATVNPLAGRKGLGGNSSIAKTSRKRPGIKSTRQLSDFNPTDQANITGLLGSSRIGGRAKDALTDAVNDKPLSGNQIKAIKNAINSGQLSRGEKATLLAALQHDKNLKDNLNNGGVVPGGGGVLPGGGGPPIIVDEGGSGGSSSNYLPPVPVPVDSDLGGEASVEEGQASNPQEVWGCQITELNPDGNAAKEGMMVGDVILSINGRATPDFETLRAVLEEAGNEAEAVFLNKENGKVERIVLHPVDSRIGAVVEEVQVR